MQEARLSALALALVAAVVLATASSASGAPHVQMRKVVNPGQMVTVRVRDFPAGTHVHVQFGLWSSPPMNCCVTKPVPAVGEPGLLIPESGNRNIRVRFGRAYARCVGYTCRDPVWTRWKPGSQIYVSVITDETPDNESAVYASRRARVARGP